MKTLLYLLFILLPLGASASISLESSRHSTAGTLFEKLLVTDDLELTISTDVGAMIKNKYEDIYQEATVRLNLPDMHEIEWSARVKARGVYRKRLCDFPPVKINFGKELSEFLNVVEMGGLKIVTKCNDEVEDLQLVQKEFLAYQLYNNMTKESFRTKLLTIHWNDTAGAFEGSTQLSFIIESKEELAARLNGREIEQYSTHPDSLDILSATRSALFQYMIGNLDWSIDKMRNVVLVKTDGGRKVKVVPYDFDFCAMVDAPYATVPSSLNLKFKGDRVYLGPEHESQLSLTKDLFEGQKKDIFKTIRKCPEMSAPNKSKVRKYIASFFEALEEPVKLPTHYQPRNGQ